LYEEKITVKTILNKIVDKKNIIEIIGAKGVGKTITIILMAEMLVKNNKILLIEGDIDKKDILELYEKKEKRYVTNIKKNIDVINIKKICKTRKNKIEKNNKEICKLKKKYDYVFIEANEKNYWKFEEIADKKILIINANVLDLIKIKKIIKNNKQKLKTIINNYNYNSINKKILKKIVINKIEIIEKIKNNKKYNLIINNNANVNFLDYKTKNKIKNIIKKIGE